MHKAGSSVKGSHNKSSYWAMEVKVFVRHLNVATFQSAECHFDQQELSIYLCHPSVLVGTKVPHSFRLLIKRRWSLYSIFRTPERNSQKQPNRGAFLCNNPQNGVKHWKKTFQPWSTGTVKERRSRRTSSSPATTTPESNSKQAINNRRPLVCPHTQSLLGQCPNLSRAQSANSASANTCPLL